MDDFFFFFNVNLRNDKNELVQLVSDLIQRDKSKIFLSFLNLGKKT